MEVLACEPWALRPTSPSRSPQDSKAAGRFGKQDFVYIPEEDAYRGHGKRYASYLFLTMNQKRKPRE